MMRMFNPPHPGIILRDDILPTLGLSVTKASKILGVNRTTLSRVMNGRAAISPEMALRLENWLGIENGGRAEVWIEQQAAYDLWQARQKWKPTLRDRIAKCDPTAPRSPDLVEWENMKPVGGEIW